MEISLWCFPPCCLVAGTLQLSLSRKLAFTMSGCQLTVSVIHRGLHVVFKIYEHYANIVSILAFFGENEKLHLGGVGGGHEAIFLEHRLPVNTTDAIGSGRCHNAVVFIFRIA